MDTGKYSEKDFMNYMLDNLDLERVMCLWNGNKMDPVNNMMMLETLLTKCIENRGLIVSVSGDMIEAGADNIELCTLEQHIDLNTVVDKDDHMYILGFTTRERFQTYNDDLAGMAMFLDDIFALVDIKSEVDGIVINCGTEEVIIEKNFINAVVQVLEKKKLRERND